MFPHGIDNIIEDVTLIGLTEPEAAVVRLEIEHRHSDDMRKLADQINRQRAALEFYANKGHWMGITEASDHSNLVAHGLHFDGTSHGWIEACAALTPMRE